MTIILVDDESLALQYLEKLLNQVSDFEIIGTYTNPYIAKKHILQKKPKIVFLDIEMPGLNGIDLAEQIQQSLPNIHIVFVTAYNEYAVKAFELNAIDYIVKPFQLSRLHKTLQRFQVNEIHESHSMPTVSMNRICAFQSLSFTRVHEGIEVLDVRWRTSKARSLFAYLLHHRNRYVSRDSLLELFWPETDQEKGKTQLYSTIYQIRRTLAAIQFNITITNHENGYQLNMNDVQFDVEEWEKALLTHTNVNDANLSVHQKLIETYRGDYLSEEDFLWAEHERERLRVLALQHLTKIADYYESKNKFGDAISIYLRLQKIAPHVDYSYFNLMQLYSKIPDIHAVEQQYIHLKVMLLDEYGVEPKPAIQNWYVDWLKSVAVGDQ